MPASLRHGASQQTTLLRPCCMSASNRSSSSCYTGCNAEDTVVLGATSGKAKLDMATSGRGRRTSASIPPDGRQPTEWNSFASWAQQRSRRSRLWSEKEEKREILERLYVRFGDFLCIGFWDHVDKPTDKQRWKSYRCDCMPS